MYTYRDLQALQQQSLKMQGWIRKQTFSPELEKTLRRFSSWEVAELIFQVNQSTFRGRLAADPSLPTGEVQEDGRQRWYSLDEINELRRRMKINRRSLLPPRPANKRAIRAAIANFKGGAGKSTVALHFAHAAALDGYRVLCVDFDPQATLSHSMGLGDVSEERTVWGIMARDLIHETDRMNAATVGAASGSALPQRRLPASIRDMGIGELRSSDFIRQTSWSTIDVVPSCANAAFVEFASAQYRHLNPDWSFFAAVDRYLSALPDDMYDILIFDCPPAIGYQSMNAVFAADVLYIPSGPGYWEYDSTTSFIGQLSEALEDLDAGFGAGAFPAGNHPAAPGFPAGNQSGDPTFPAGNQSDASGFPAGNHPATKAFLDMRFLLTRYEPGNDLHRAMYEAFGKVFGDRLTENPIELTRAVEQSGRFLSSVYEIDYRSMTRETWRRARGTFDRAYVEFRNNLITAWDKMEERR